MKEKPQTEELEMEQESKQIIDGLKDLKNEFKSKDNSLDSDIDLDQKIQDANLKMMANAEEQKLILRDKLVTAVKHIIWFQLVFFNIIIFMIVAAVTAETQIFKDIDTELAIQLFEFLKYYISATIVELLGMLVFILHYVFSGFKFMKRLIQHR